MDKYRPLIEELSRDAARAILKACPDKLLHDLVCLCGGADAQRGYLMLVQAEWTVKDAFEAWYEEWLTGASHA